MSRWNVIVSLFASCNIKFNGCVWRNIISEDGRQFLEDIDDTLCTENGYEK